MVLQVIGPLAAAGVGAFQASKQADAQNLANAIQWRAVQEQQRSNRAQERLQKATRTDAYGNAVKYVPGRGFVTDVTALTRSLLNAEQKEQLANLRDDAPRQRAANERMDARSKKGDEAFDDSFNRFRYSRAPNRRESEARAIVDALMARNERNRGSNDSSTGQELVNMAARIGSSGAANNIVEALRRQGSSSPTVSETISDARRLGRNDYQQDMNARAMELNEVNGIRSIADATASVPIEYTSLNNDLTARQEGAIGSLSDVIGENGREMASVLGDTAQLAFRSFPDMSPIASALGRLNFGSGSSRSSTSPQQSAYRPVKGFA
jgi:hypothetical protein